MKWHRYIPQYEGDISLPAQWYEVDLDRAQDANGILAKQQVENVLKISTASLFTGVEEIKYKSEKQQYEVFVTDEKARYAVYAFEGEDINLLCQMKMKELRSTSVITAERFSWEINYNSNVWESEALPDQLAESVSSLEGQNLQLKGLTLPKGEEKLSYDYQVRCRAYVNSTYDIWSRPFGIVVGKQAKIKNVKVYVDSEDNAEVELKPDFDKSREHTFNAQKSLTVRCEAEVENQFMADVRAYWTKCLDDSCNEEVEVLPKMATLQFDADSTTIDDEGFYFCRAFLRMHDFNYNDEKTAKMKLSRFSPPNIVGLGSSDTLFQFTDPNLERLALSCMEKHAGPRAAITWEYTPSKDEVPPKYDPNIIGKKVIGNNYIYTLSLNPLSELQSGIYKCIATNQYGTSEATFNVQIKQYSSDFY
ncbi:hypothetical protein Ciccas_009024 [Cichlidogyrus casuarinus]|uniref:Ig-like domain-containing protein n=1 Tax=Cichlidogyrus casuarinus TaxID=1844966 RepID=A0ABD2PY81_9PLAT